MPRYFLRDPLLKTFPCTRLVGYDARIAIVVLLSTTLASVHQRIAPPVDLPKVLCHLRQLLGREREHLQEPVPKRSCVIVRRWYHPVERRQLRSIEIPQ